MEALYNAILLYLPSRCYAIITVLLLSINDLAQNLHMFFKFTSNKNTTNLGRTEKVCAPAKKNLFEYEKVATERALI